MQAQSFVSGVVNDVASSVTAIESDRVTVADVTVFAPGDTVLLIQMKGAIINTPNNSGFGFLQDQFGSPGGSEFLIVNSVNIADSEIVFTADIIGNYDPDGVVQIVRVPYYESAIVDGPVTAPLWDSDAGTGGVIVMIVGGVLDLHAPISADGLGFEGGKPALGDGICASEDPEARNRFFFDASQLLGGFKGEGVAVQNDIAQPLYPEFARGKGALYTGGGGGNGRFSGGGGGGHIGTGGNGDWEDEVCVFISDIMGIRGYSLSSDFPDGIFHGSGGGSSTYIDGSTGSPGGRGGGTVIIIADKISGNGHTISAAGAIPPVTASGEAGAGGGGAGGTVAISVVTFGTTPLLLDASGGPGGNTASDRGAGGGGGGGRVWLSTPHDPYPEVTVNVEGGSGGQINYLSLPASSAAEGGNSGRVDTDFTALLNGFLFNSIWSDFTGLPIDSICYGGVPHAMRGSEPVGGTPPYTYQWQKSYDISNPALWANIDGDGQEYLPSASESDTVWFRRVVTDSDDIAPLTDISKFLYVIVHPLITDNIIAQSDTICYEQTPALLGSAGPDPGGGSGFYHYLWQESIDEISFDTTATGWEGISYQPGALNETTRYRRVVRSGMCYDTSEAVKITVLPLIENNAIATDQTICEGDLFAPLSGSGVPLDGGDGQYSFAWQSAKGPDMAWEQAAGDNEQITYTPDHSLFPDTLHFRRVVYSGAGDVCSSISDTVTLIMHSAISGNLIDADQTICEGDTPDPLQGGVPGGGDGSVIYRWQSSIDSDNWADAGNGDADQQQFAPGGLNDTTWYRRVVYSSDLVCTDTSNMVVVNVHKAITDIDIYLLSGGTDTTLCMGGVPNLLTGSSPAGGTDIPGDYQFQWKQSDDGTLFTTATGDATDPDYQPSAPDGSRWYRRVVTSGLCSEVSNVVGVNVLDPIENNTIPADTSVCYNTAPSLFSSSLPAGGDGSYSYLWQISGDGGGTWGDATGVNDQRHYEPPAHTDPVIYRRTVFSGPQNTCEAISDELSVGIDPRPTATITTEGDAICAGDINSAANITLTGAAPWSLRYGYGDVSHTITGITAGDHTITVTPQHTGHLVYTLLEVTDGNECSAFPSGMTGEFNLMVLEDPVAVAGDGDSGEVCGLTVALEPIPSHGSGSWSWPSVPVDDYQITDEESGQWSVTVSQHGIWEFWWVERNSITGWYGTSRECVDSARFDVTFWEEPYPVSAGDDFTTSLKFGNLSAELPQISTSASWSYSGDPLDIVIDSPLSNSTTFLISGNEMITTYDMVWSVSNGVCKLHDTVRVTYNPIPQGFSPDGDNINDTFEIPGLENTQNELVIINRSGAEVVRFTNYSSVTGYWDGRDKYGNEVPDGTYYYLLNISSPYSERISGYVIVRRGR